MSITFLLQKKYTGSNCWLKFFYGNGGSAEKKRETAGNSLKNNGGYQHFFDNFRR